MYSVPEHAAFDGLEASRLGLPWNLLRRQRTTRAPTPTAFAFLVFGWRPWKGGGLQRWTSARTDRDLLLRGVL